MSADWFTDDNIDIETIKNFAAKDNCERECIEVLYRHIENAPLFAKMINLIIEIAGEEKMMSLLKYDNDCQFMVFALGIAEPDEKDKKIIRSYFGWNFQYLAVEDRIKLFDAGIVDPEDYPDTLRIYFPQYIVGSLRERILSIPQYIIDHVKIYNMIVSGKNDELAEHVEKFLHSDNDRLMVLMGEKIKLNIGSSVKYIIPRITHPEAFFESFGDIIIHLENGGIIECRPCCISNDTVILHNVVELLEVFSRYIGAIDWSVPGKIEKFLAPFESGKYRNNGQLINYCRLLTACFAYNYRRFVEVYNLAIKVCKEKELIDSLRHGLCGFYLHIMGICKICWDDDILDKFRVFAPYLPNEEIKKFEDEYGEKKIRKILDKCRTLYRYIQKQPPVEKFVKGF